VVQAMHNCVASVTQRDQVVLRIIAALAAKILVMNFQVRSGPATLASPAITAQHLGSESIVQFEIKPQTWLFV
jgi:hypothetical protein